MKAKIIRKNEKNIQPYRLTVQIALTLLCIWIGIEFYLFIRYLESGGSTPFYERPPGVDGFLPISSLMNVYQFLSTQTIHPYHPAGFFIFLTIVAISLVAGKSFCSWICPVGFLSESLGSVSEIIFRSKIKMPRLPDYFLRSLKYLMLGYLLYVIAFVMGTDGVLQFLNTPYNLMADIKMYYFFAHISRTALTVILVLVFLSLIFRNFWCRYLCPYGAFLGWTSLLSFIKIRRNESTCIDCGLCAKACPSFIKVDKVKTVYSDECTSCLHCIDACPVHHTLQLHIMKKPVNKFRVGLVIILMFLAGTGLGMLTGNWQNKITKEKYLFHYQHLHLYGHPGMRR